MQVKQAVGSWCWLRPLKILIRGTGRPFYFLKVVNLTEHTFRYIQSKMPDDQDSISSAEENVEKERKETNPSKPHAPTWQQ